MAALSDVSVGVANEATPGTYATPTRWWEVLPPEFDVVKNTVQGQGMRVGTRVDRSGRRVIVSMAGSGKFGLEAVTKGMGLLFESMLGTSAVTLVSGSTYQHNFTYSTGVTIPSRTIQVGAVETGGTVDAHSYLGCMVDTWDVEIGSAENGLIVVTTNWDAMNYSTAQAYAAPSYAAAPSLFHGGQVAVTLGGVVTAPTTIALATGGTAVTNVRSFKLSGDNQAQKNRWNFLGTGRKARQLVGDLGITGELEVEYSDTVVRDAFLADTELALTVTVTSTEALSTGFAQLQFTLPAIKLDGEMPKPSGTDTPTLKVPFKVLDNLTATQPIWISTRTADTAA